MLPRPDPMLRYLIVDILLPLLVFALLRSFLRGIFQTGRNVTRPPQQAPPPSRPNVVVGGELKKVPVCGPYVSTRARDPRPATGQLLHFFCKPDPTHYHPP